MINKADQILQILSAVEPPLRSGPVTHSNYTFLVSVILSARSRDAQVDKATPQLFAIADTPAKMCALSLSQLESMVSTIGFYKNKAKHILAMSKRLIDHYNSQVPDTFEELITLPGVGRKSANVVMNALFNKPVIAVDTHVYRVARRLGLSDGNTPEKVESDLMRVVPEKYLKSISDIFIWHGRRTCDAKKPQCSICPVKNLCRWFAEEVANKSTSK